MSTTPTEEHLVQNHQVEAVLSRLRLQQSYPVAIGAGAGAAIIGAIVWAAITVSTEYQIGWMAIGLGLAVGFAVRLGKGIEKPFGIIGAVFALLGCLLGNFFSLVGFASHEWEMGLIETLGSFDYSSIPELMKETTAPMDFLFYAFAILQGYKFSFRKISPSDLEVSA